MHVSSPFACQPCAQVQAAEVEPELEAEHHEEALDVIGRLRERVGDGCDPPGLDLRERPEACFVSRMKLEAPARWLVASEQPLLPARRRPRLVEQVARTLAALAELGAFQHAALQLELAKVLLDGIEVVVAELFPHHREEASEALRAEARAMFVGDLPKLPEYGQIKPSTRTDLLRIQSGLAPLQNEPTACSLASASIASR